MKVTLEPPSEEEDDTVVESSDSDSDPADEILKQQQRNLVSVKRGSSTVVLNQYSIDVKPREGEEEMTAGSEGPKLLENWKTREQKCEKVEEMEENHFKTSSSGKKRHSVENGGEEWRREANNDDNCVNCVAAEEVKRILEELENIKQRISQMELDVLNRIGL